MDINAAALASIRQLNGLSQAELARRSGVSQGYISELESGTKSQSGPATIKKLADALSVPIGALAAVRVHPNVATDAEAVS